MIAECLRVASTLGWMNSLLKIMKVPNEIRVRFEFDYWFKPKLKTRKYHVFLFFRFKPKTIKQKYGSVFRILLSESKDEKGENHIKNGPILVFANSFFRFEPNKQRWRKRAGGWKCKKKKSATCCSREQTILPV